MSLSSSVDRAVKAYIDHTNVILAGDASLASLDVSMLQQPFNDLAAPQLAQLALAYQQNESSAAPAEVDGKKKRNYKPRDPNAPKRPLTAYFRYLQEQRGPAAEEMAKSGNGPGKPGDISKAVTERWKAMTEEEQLPYKEAYQRALKDYEREVSAYKATGEADAEIEPEEQANGAAEKAEDSESESESSTTDEEEVAMPPPPPKVASPEAKKTPKTPKSAMKKKKVAEDVPATPQFSSINPSVPIPSSQRKSSSPELKRKAAADASEDGTKKKRGRKTNKQKEAEAAEAAEIAATPTVPASDASGDKPKKDKKKKRKSEVAA
jgi:hypothetical protein